ncbi:hypothetical protein NHH03_09645 [Stieleria sp. TO1_6]|uniref:hypothetical protein n=1 Tax=Stieleria tagensis TaxID=2956795 RepID=UPI00209A9D26|nr:hypothetical protein [Stieleria tagensis]MCO8121999.1 hypothetical protein [Stieleria tagensis]
MNSSVRHRGLAALTLMFWMVAQAASAVAEVDSGNSTVVTVRVVDESGQSISDAAVSLVGLVARADVGMWHQTPGTLAVPAENSGDYQVAIDRSHEQFLHHDRVLLIVASPQRGMIAREVLQTRLRCGVPIEIELDKHPATKIQVVDDQGEPVVGVQLAPAVWGSTAIPKFEGMPGAAATDDQGTTTATWVGNAPLTMVYAWGESIGYQRLPITRSDEGELSVVTIPTRETEGRWTAETEPAADSDFFKTEITVVSSPLELTFTQGAKQSYSWGTTRQRTDGTLEPIRIAWGQLVCNSQMPNSVSLTTKHQLSSVRAIDDVQPYVIEWIDGIRVRGQIVDEQTGDPLSGVAILQFSFSHGDAITGDDGTFQLWCAPGERISYFPSDYLGRHIKAGGFYLYPQELPTDGKLQLEPQPLQRCSAAIGKVIDHQGDPVAAAEIDCEYKDERFTKTQTLFSDADGTFPFLGVLENAAVQLTARTGRAMTEQPESVQLSAEAEVELAIKPRHGVAIRGRVVTVDGRPINHVSVTVRTPQVFQQELYNGRDSTAADLFDADVSIVTDDDGIFVSPDVIDWQREVSVELQAAGYRTAATYWRDASVAGKGETDLDLGTITMYPQWKTVDQNIQVIDADSKQPLANAKIACRGAYVEHQRQHSDADGQARFSIPDSTAVFAIHQDGYHPAVLVRQAGEMLGPIELKASNAGPLSPPLIATESESRQVDAAGLAGRLLQRFSKPGPTDTVHRISSYYRALSIADFETALGELTVLAESPNLKSTVGMLLTQMDWLDAAQRKRVFPLLGDDASFYHSMTLADRSVESEERLELLGEALVLARQQTGDNALASMGRLASKLLELGETEMAKELLSDAYTDHPKLAEILSAGERKKDAGVARVFLPVYAVVDPQRASELIRLTAYADEIDRLQTLAVRFATEYGDQSPQSLCKQLGLDQLSSRGMTGGHMQLKHRDAQRGLALAELCDDGLGKADFLFELAKTSDADLATKKKLARQALKIMQQPVDGAMILQPRHWLAERIGDVAKWDVALAEEYLFASIWVENSSSRITPFFPTATLAILLAPVNQQLAKALVEPCFEDWSWLFADRDQSVMFAQALPLHAAAAIDPDWTVGLIDNLFDNHLHENESRKLLIVSGIVTSLVD